MRKIRNNNFAASPAVVKDGEIQLLHADEFKHTGSHLTGCLHEDQCLVHAFDTDTEFFYTIENFDSTDINSRELIHLERGLGHIEKSGKTSHFIRDVVLEVQQRDSDLPIGKDGHLDFPDDCYLVIGSYIPRNYIDLFYNEHSIVCSTGALTPSPIEIEENSVVGRLHGEIKSLDSEDLCFILTTDYVIKSLKDINAPILIATNHFEMLNDKSKLLTGHVVLKSRQGKPRNREKGSIIFNSSTNSLEFFDGSKWKTIKTEN